ncbi:hypothetical protein LDENG_00181610 [Lucifuga dentata]|nr:hypothetical protein LDENG_00181610 [Lucifuga dentata]
MTLATGNSWPSSWDWRSGNTVWRVRSSNLWSGLNTKTWTQAPGMSSWMPFLTISVVMRPLGNLTLSCRAPAL